MVVTPREFWQVKSISRLELVQLAILLDEYPGEMARTGADAGNRSR